MQTENYGDPLPCICLYRPAVPVQSSVLFSPTQRYIPTRNAEKNNKLNRFLFQQKGALNLFPRHFFEGSFSALSELVHYEERPSRGSRL